MKTTTLAALVLVALPACGLMATPAYADPPGCPPVVSGDNTMFLVVGSPQFDKDISIVTGLMHEGVGEIILGQKMDDPWPGLFKQMVADIAPARAPVDHTIIDKQPVGIVTAQKKPVIPLNDRRIAEMDWPYLDAIKAQLDRDKKRQLGAPATNGGWLNPDERKA